MNNLDFNEILKNVNIKKSVSTTRIVLFGIIIIMIFYFLFTFNRLNDRKKEIECIEYYQAYGYKLSGCDSTLRHFNEVLESD